MPAAGLGTRMRPLTDAIPKEMLPVGRKPVLELVLEELRDSGVDDVLVVVSPGKEIIERYFGTGVRLGLRCEYAVQTAMRGVGDAVLMGREWADGSPCVIAFGDSFIAGPDAPATQRAVSVHMRSGAFATALVERVPRARTGLYGIIAAAEGSCLPDGSFQMSDIVEKPDPEHAPSDLAVAARWVVEPAFFDYLEGAEPLPSGEIGVTDNIQRAIHDGAVVWGVPLLPSERRWDVGNWRTYLTAAAIAAADDPDAGATVRACLGMPSPPGGDGV